MDLINEEQVEQVESDEEEQGDIEIVLEWSMEKITLPKLLGQKNILKWHELCSSYVEALPDEIRRTPPIRFKIMASVDEELINEAYAGINLRTTNAEELLEHLLRRFHTSRIADANFELHNRRKKLSETVTEYAFDLKNLADRVDAEMRVEELRRIFVEGLPVAARHDIYAMTYGKTFEETIAVAQQILLKYEPAPRPQNNGTSSHVNSNRNQRNSTRPRNQNVECFFCHKRGHKKAECFSNPESSNYRRPKNQ